MYLCSMDRVNEGGKKLILAHYCARTDILQTKIKISNFAHAQKKNPTCTITYLHTYSYIF